MAVRLIFVALLVVITVVTVSSSRSVEDFGPPTVVGLIIAAVGVGAVVLLLDWLTPNKKLTSVAGVYLGICLGMVAALAIGALIDTVTRAWEINSGPAQIYLNLTKIIFGIVLCYLSVSIVLTTKDDFRLVIPYVEFSKQPGGVAPILLDSSSLIDGRIEALSASRIIDAQLVVPKFILDELQTLCDSEDKLKRQKGKRGLDLMSRLQTNHSTDIRIEAVETEGRPVDRVLIDLALREQMRIATTDVGLQKVAQISGVVVINLHEISEALRPALQLGDGITVELTRLGDQEGQGIGHLPDGTMIVVDGGSDSLRKSVRVLVTNVLQTAGGRIIFARLEPPASGSAQAMSAAATTQPAIGSSGSSAPTGTSRENFSRGSTGNPRNPRRS